MKVMHSVSSPPTKYWGTFFVKRLCIGEQTFLGKFFVVCFTWGLMIWSCKGCRGARGGNYSCTIYFLVKIILVHSLNPPVTNGGREYGNFKTLNNGWRERGWNNLHVNGRVRHNGRGGGVDLELGGNPFQSNFGATKKYLTKLPNFDPIFQKCSASVFQKALLNFFVFLRFEL